jgi:hypothetical protein
MRAARTLWMLLLIIASTLQAGTIQAGTLELTNGAVIPGEFKRMESGRVVWAAELIGDITVEAAHVAKLESKVGDRLRVGQTDLPKNCALSARSADLTISCADRPAMAATWQELGQPARTREGSGKITTSMTFERGNNHSDELELDAVARWSREQLRHNLEGSIDYEEKRDRKAEDEASLDYQMDYLLRSGWYAYGRTEYSRDRFDTVQEELLTGFGIGRTWTIFDSLKVLFQGGPDIGRFDVQGLGRAKENGGNLQWRLEQELDVWKLKAKLFHDGEHGWIFRDTDLYRLDTRSGIEVPLLYGILAELRLEYSRTGVNVPGIDNTDIEWVFALGYKW